MKRALIIGCPGSGKSTFARALAEKTGLPLYYRDRMYWNADKTKVPREIFLQNLESALSKDEWIIDGNYGSTMEQRLQCCDTVFFLDYPTEVCLSGIRERSGKPRPDMPWVDDPNEPDTVFLEFVRAFQEESRPNILRLSEQYPEKEWIIFRAREESDAYLSAILSCAVIL